MDRDIYPVLKMAKEKKGHMTVREAGRRGGEKGGEKMREKIQEAIKEGEREEKKYAGQR